MHDRLALQVSNLKDIEIANVQTKAGVLKAFMASLALVRDYARVHSINKCYLHQDQHTQKLTKDEGLPLPCQQQCSSTVL